MRTTYIHLTQEERYHIYIEHKKKVSAGQIAKDLNRNKSTITRELERNTGN
ncbi:MAG: IS30 family transposase, partial [Methylococcales bacterium]